MNRKTLLQHNNDIQRLVEDGFNIDYSNGHLIVNDIPYLASNNELAKGLFVVKIAFSEDNAKQIDHQVYWCGEKPHQLDGSEIAGLNPRHTPRIVLTAPYNDLIVNWQLSNKPSRGTHPAYYADFFDKISTYTGIISGPAMSRYPDATYKTFSQPQSEGTDENSVFCFPDTMSTRNEISDLSEKFNNEIVAIIGLGGTGSYVFDFIAKMPVREIRVFDDDTYQEHNSFRSPGKMSADEFGKYKVNVMKGRYDNFRKNISAYDKKLNNATKDDLGDVTFAFVCVDSGVARNEIIDVLSSLNIPFIDTGIGISRSTPNSVLLGNIRTTYFSTDRQQIDVVKRQVPRVDVEDDIYKTNVQIAELNAINACMAVIWYKQLKGFYYTDENDTNRLLNIADCHVVGDGNENQ